MATFFNYIKSYLLDNNPGLIGTYGSPAAPTVGDTDWSGVNASTASVDDAFNMTNGQIPIGKTGAAAVSNPTPAPVLTAGTSGSLAAGTYEVAYTWKRDAYSETQISPVGSITFGSGTTNKISVAAVTPLPATITSVNWYMSDAPGSITLKFIANNSGGAFSISTLPIGGALGVPASNSTATNNHPIKATLTGSNGVGVTNGPGSITLGLAVTGDISASGGVVNVAKINGVAVTGTPSAGYVPTATGSSAATWQAPAGGTTIASGTSLPGSPASGDIFIRTDLKTINRFNGSTWDVIGFTNALTSAHIHVGNGSNVATDVAMSGDATIANTGAVTVSKINGVSVSGTPSTGQVPTATGTTTATWQTPSGGGGGGAFVGAHVYNSADISVPNNTLTTITFDSERFDTDTFHDTSTNTSRLTIPTGKGGYYIVSAAIRTDGGSSGQAQVRIMKNNTTYIAINAINLTSGGANYNTFSTPVVSLADADYVELKVNQTTGVTISVAGAGTADYSPDFSLVKVG